MCWPNFLLLYQHSGPWLFGTETVFNQKQCEGNILFNCSLCWQWQTLTDPLFLLFRLICSGQLIGTNELKLMKREWNPAVSITTRMAAPMVRGRGQRSLPGYSPDSLEVPLLYWATRLTPRWPPNWPLTWEVEPNQGSHAGKVNAADPLLRTQSTPLRPRQDHTTWRPQIVQITFITIRMSTRVFGINKVSFNQKLLKEALKKEKQYRLFCYIAVCTCRHNNGTTWVAITLLLYTLKCWNM